MPFLKSPLEAGTKDESVPIDLHNESLDFTTEINTFTANLPIFNNCTGEFYITNLFHLNKGLKLCTSALLMFHLFIIFEFARSWVE